jgi:chromosome segregation ATPase
MSGNDLPPLDECLSAMDERIEFLSSALSSLSEELTSRKPAAGGAANPLAVELTRVKAQLKETEAKLANSSSGDGASLAAMKDELSALRIENAELKATSSPTAGDGGRGSGTEVKAMKSKLVQANNEIDQLKKELSEKTEELEGMEDALSQAQQAAAYVFLSHHPLGSSVSVTDLWLTRSAALRAQ